MITLAELNPIVAFLWLILTAGVAMFLMNPAILIISLTGALSYYLLRNPDTRLKEHAPYLLLFALSLLLNPIFSHAGSSVLFVLNDNPVTLEAVLYGLVFGLMLLCTLYWFRSFQQIMTGDKLLYVFGSALPKLTLILSIALRYIPLLRQQAKRVRDSQKALGLFRDENLIDRIRGEVRIFSVLVSWALENGVITADSMSARGYGVGRRTRFALFHFRMRDGLACALCALLSAVTIWAAASGSLSCIYYPTFAMPAPTPLAIAGTIAYGLLSLLPVIMEVEEMIRWKFLKSKI